MSNDRFPTLSELQGWELTHRHLDPRGRPLVDESGEQVGRVCELRVDVTLYRVSALVLDDGRAFSMKAVQVRPDAVILQEEHRGGGAGRSLSIRKRSSLSGAEGA